VVWSRSGGGSIRSRDSVRRSAGSGWRVGVLSRRSVAGSEMTERRSVDGAGGGGDAREAGTGIGGGLGKTLSRYAELRGVRIGVPVVRSVASWAVGIRAGGSDAPSAAAAAR
jgi:hypothetical protein